MIMQNVPGLFGLTHSNRDFSQKASWGKNSFNNAFPAALACYMFSKGIKPVYLCLDRQCCLVQSSISGEEVFALPPLSEQIYFNFECAYTPYAPLVLGNLPGVDLIIQDLSTPHKNCVRAIEIKLTALPDNTTCEQEEHNYGSEIVVRPDTILYASLHMASRYQSNCGFLQSRLDPICQQIDDWQEPSCVRPHVYTMSAVLTDIAASCLQTQFPLLLQPVWKTRGKTSMLAEDCLDMFIWSDLGLIKLACLEAEKERAASKIITRIERTVIWITKMLADFATNGMIDYHRIIDQLSYNTKNDKAFALSGRITHQYMSCESLTRPRITRQCLKHIILGGGHMLLSPERRFDAILVHTPDLFDDNRFL